jgi:uncharacterized membrane protein YwaF
MVQLDHHLAFVLRHLGFFFLLLLSLLSDTLTLVQTIQHLLPYIIGSHADLLGSIAIFLTEKRADTCIYLWLIGKFFLSRKLPINKLPTLYIYHYLDSRASRKG